MLPSLTSALRIAGEVFSIARSYAANRRTLQALWSAMERGEQPAQRARAILRVLFEGLPPRKVNELLETLEKLGHFENLERIFAQDDTPPAGPRRPN